MAEKSIDLSEYFFVDLTFKRDLTGEKPNDLLIYKGNDLLQHKKHLLQKVLILQD